MVCRWPPAGLGCLRRFIPEEVEVVFIVGVVAETVDDGRAPFLEPSLCCGFACCRRGGGGGALGFLAAVLVEMVCLVLFKDMAGFGGAAIGLLKKSSGLWFGYMLQMLLVGVQHESMHTLVVSLPLCFSLFVSCVVAFFFQFNSNSAMTPACQCNLRGLRGIIRQTPCFGLLESYESIAKKKNQNRPSNNQSVISLHLAISAGNNPKPQLIHQARNRNLVWIYS